MRKPIDPAIIRHPLKFGPVGPHPPELDLPLSLSIEPDPLAVGRIVGSVAMVEAVRNLRLGAAAKRAPVDLIGGAPLTHVNQCATLGGPSVPIGWRELCNFSRGPPRDWQGIDATVAILGRIADDEGLAIRGNAVIVVDVDGKSGVDCFQSGGGERYAIKPARSVDDQSGSIRRPVRSFDMGGRGENRLR